MKQIISVFVLVLLVAGCSRKEENNSGIQPAVMSADLGKDADYFSNLYGPAKSEKRANVYDFSLPSVGHLIKLNEPFVIRQYAGGKLGVTVIFREASPQAIWVKYNLPNPWTQEQIKAALGAYDKKWTATSQSVGLTFIMQDSAPMFYQGSSKIFGYKLMNDLMLYSPQLYQDLLQKISTEEQQKRAVPKF